MDKDAVKRRQKELSRNQAMYVARRETGASREESAIFAGYPAGQEAGKQVEESVVVQAELAKAREEVSKRLNLSRDTVLQGFIDAYDMAKVMADPASMIRAMAEIGKMLGMYAAEKKKVEFGLDAESREALKHLPDSELRKIARGRIIESTATRVDDAD